MNILYTANDKFVPQIGAAICSVCENNKDVDQITFYIFSAKISSENKKKLKNLGREYGRDVEITEIGNLEEHLGFSFDTSGWNPIVLSRLIVDKLLPSKVQRIIYLDGDTIVLGNLSELWETDMRDSVIGACIEPTINKENLKKLNMEDTPYINAGVLLINLDRWRKEKTGERILKYYRDRGGRVFANDQGCINGALKGEIHYLPLVYNYCNSYQFYNYKTFKKIMHPIEYISEQEYSLYVENPIIIHYLGEERPWREGNRHQYREEFWQYLKMTPWKDMPCEQGWKLYFLCFYTFNFFMKPFPFLRWRIIDNLIPQVMKLRARNEKRK